VGRMDDTKKMLVTIINGQSALKAEVLGKIGELRVEMNQKFDSLDNKIEKVEKNLTKRIDKIGSQLAYLEDDTPTKEEFDGLEKRVDKLETKVALV